MKIKDYLLFIFVFLLTVFFDFLLFRGITKQIWGDRLPDALGFGPIALVVFFWIILGMPGLLAYYVTFVHKKTDKSLTIKSSNIPLSINTIDQDPSNKYIVFTLVFMVLFIIISDFLFNTILKPVYVEPYTYDVPTGTLPINLTSRASQAQQVSIGDFFFFAIPKPLASLTLDELPNDMNPRNVVEYNGSLWFVGGGSIVEYATSSGKLVSYSNLKKANCDSNIVIADNFLFTSCHTDNIEDAFGHTEQLTTKIFTGHYSVFKINPITHTVEHVFSNLDGLQNRYNYNLVADGNTVWIQTFDGVGRINAQTNKVDFYVNELGIQGKAHEVNDIFVDTDYVWVDTSANAYSQGGLSVFNKNTQTWKAFNTHELKDYSFDRFDLEGLPNGWAIKSIPQGIQIGFRDGEIDGIYDRFVEKQYNYASGKWTKVGEQQITGKYYTQAVKQLSSQYPFNPVYTTVDSNGLTQIIFPQNTTYQIDGRDNYFLSPVIGDRRYVLTSATVDVIDDASSFRKILVKLGSRLENGIDYADPYAFQGLVQFLVDPGSLLAIVTDSACGGQGCAGSQKVWLIDLNAAKIDRIYTKADGLPSGELLTGLNMQRNGNTLQINDKNGSELFAIDSATYNLTVSTK